VVSDFERGEPSVLARIKDCRPLQLALSTVTVLEVQYGLQLNPTRAKRLEPVLRDFVDSIDVLDYNVADATATVRAQLKRSGRPVGAYGALIAGCALSRGLILVTHNTREFGSIGGLSVEDWRT
jgi:tRNA(fMet)-specific endonuclease VapC